MALHERPYVAGLTLQEKLALTMTSAQSLSALAGTLGVSRRTLGRWLHEGDPEHGVKQIPQYAKTAINNIFSIHKDIVISQAKVDQLPYSSSRPVLFERKMLNTGEPGERILAERTIYIRNDLRKKVIIDQAKSKKYSGGSVRSSLTLYNYFKAVATERLKKNRRLSTPENIESTTKSIMSGFLRSERRSKKKKIDRNAPFAMHTKYVNMSDVVEEDDEYEDDEDYYENIAESIERQLSLKHAPSTIEPGTALADQYLFKTSEAGRYKKPKTNAKVKTGKNAKQSEKSVQRPSKGAGRRKPQ